jgi:hypothetical protein
MDSEGQFLGMPVNFGDDNAYERTRQNIGASGCRCKLKASLLHYSEFDSDKYIPVEAETTIKKVLD